MNLTFLHPLFQGFSAPSPRTDHAALQRANSIHARLFEGFVAVWVIAYAWSWASYSLRNRVVVLELGLANHLPVDWAFQAPYPWIIAGAITLLTVAGFLIRSWRFAYAPAMVLLHLMYVIRFSQGEIPHSSNLVGTAFAGLAIAGLFFKEIGRRERMAVGFILFFTGLGYTSAAISKLIGTGPGWASSEHMLLWIFEKAADVVSRHGAWTPTLVQRMVLEMPALGFFVLLFGWVVEAAGFLFWFPRLRPWITSLFIAMHLGITMSMNIRFDAFVMQLILMGYPWGAWWLRLKVWKPAGQRVISPDAPRPPL